MRYEKRPPRGPTGTSTEWAIASTEWGTAHPGIVCQAQGRCGDQSRTSLAGNHASHSVEHERLGWLPDGTHL